MNQSSSTVVGSTSNGNASSANQIIPFYGIEIKTTVTNSDLVVENWLREIYSNYWRYGSTPNVIGMVFEHCDILQLCVGKKCLIFQLHHMRHFPHALQRFLEDRDAMFVGVKMHFRMYSSDIGRLKSTFGLNCLEYADANELMLNSYLQYILTKYGNYPYLLTLAKNVVCLNIAKPYSVINSDWRAKCLTEEQIRYASIEAYAIYKIACELPITNN